MHKQFFSNLQVNTLLFGRFQLLSCLASSHSQGVYLCKDKSLRVVKDDDDYVVIKILSRTAGLSDQEVEIFCKEMDLVRNVKHENVLSAKEFFRDEDFIAFTMDYIAGGTLADILSVQGELPISGAIDLIMQVCMGVEAIHDQGIVHRDLKPENILLNKSGLAKIADFGIAMSLSESDSFDDDLIGSINYFSPEYIESGKYDRYTDIYAIGVVLFELLTGHLPFRGQNLIETLTMRVLHEPVKPSSLRNDIPKALDQIVLKSMQRDPKKRFSNCCEMYRALLQSMPSFRVQYSREFLQSIISETVPDVDIV